ncbi:MAG: SLC13 family permease, partial [Anaerolineae bacterium]|nr:SLC13 family permease [Anaerolineae bacterium]
MNFDMLLVFGLLAAAMVLFMTERIRMDVAAMLVLLALMLTGILTPDQALAGFADPVVLMIAGLLVVGSGLYQTGVAHAIGALLTRVAGDSEPRLIVVSMIAVALLSALMSSAGATAVLIPVIVSMAWRARISPARLLLPLAIGSLLGGLLTLIGTPPNLVVSGELVRHGLAPLSFFSFTPIGLATLGLGIVFMLTLGRRLLPQKTHSGGAYNDPESNVSLGELGETYDLPEDLMRVRVRASSPLVGMTLREAALRPRYHVNVLEVQHWPHRRAAPEEAHPVTPESHLEIDDILHVQGEPANVTQMAQEERLGLLSGGPDASLLFSDELGMVELLLPPRSQLLGRTLQENRFRDKYDVTVLSLKRGDKVLAPEESAATRLRFGDTLLVLGTWARIRLLQEERRNFVVVGLPKEMLEVQRTPAHALISGVIMVGMLALMTLEIMPAVTAVLLAAVAMVLTESLTMEQVYGAMNWQSLILLAGMLPLASALQATGGVTFIANALTASLGSMGPVTVMAGIFLLTALFSQFISNTATTVLMAPIAYQAAVTLGVAPQGFLVAVAVAASTAFAMPMATMSTTMVMAPGGYRIRDYVRIGLA